MNNWELENWRKIRRLRTFTLLLLTSTFSCQKRSCLIRSKKKKPNKQKQLKSRITKLTKIIMETIIVMIIITAMKKEIIEKVKQTIVVLKHQQM